MSLSNNLIVNKSRPLVGKIKIPGDKSISHRSIILGSLSEGELVVSNFLNSDDCLSTINAMRDLGVEIHLDNDKVKIVGKGLYGLNKPKSIIDVGNSGTLIRLLTGLLSAQKFQSSITGDKSIVKRPMARVIKPLVANGARIESENYMAPIQIYPSDSIDVFNYTQEIASAQVKSCLILTALYTGEISKFFEKIPTRDHTENLLEHFNVRIKREHNSFEFLGRQNLVAKDIEIGSDISSAAFFIVAALIVNQSNLSFKNININRYRTGIITVLREMGANITITNIRTISNEQVGDIQVKHSELKSINIDGEIIPSLIDELPILFIACAHASGTSTIKGIEELRYKESDRIKSMEDGLRAIGIDVTSTNDSIKITGSKIHGGKVDSSDDHRIAMSFAIAGLVSEHSMTITNTKNIRTSFPSFVSLLREQGAEIFEA